jgi:NAD(P)-dependent dehydrogenase (short-subunit alcohol dehydrogenase family)
MHAPVLGLEQPAQVLVTGASSGIGLALVQALRQAPGVERVFAVARRAGACAQLHAEASGDGARLLPIDADLAADAGIAAVAAGVRAHVAELHLVLNCAGVLHAEGMRPEKSLSGVGRAALERSFALNACAPLLLARALQPLLARGAPRVFASLSARVGSIGDNRLGGWYAYRAAKAAQNQLLRTLAIEWRRTHPQLACVLLHPGTVDTPLSRPFQARVPPERLSSPARAARGLLDLVARLRPADSGRFLALDGSDIPW